MKLSSYYLLITPGKTDSDFIDEVIIPVGNDSTMSGESYFEKTRTNGADQYSTMLISYAYCLQSMKARNVGDRELAWSYMADALYWCGATLASKGIEDGRKRTITETKKGMSQKANSARHEKNRQIKELAFKLARENCPALNGWFSRRQAAKAIAQEIKKFADEIGNPLSNAQAEKTIYDWLGKMPEAKSLFQSKKNKISE